MGQGCANDSSGQKPGVQRRWVKRTASSAVPARPAVGVALAVALAMASVSGCHSSSHLPSRSSAAYVETVSAFYVGLSALQVGDDIRADSSLDRATQLAPGEPAAWADWAVLALRQRNFDLAAERLNRALKLAPENDQIYDLLGVLESDRGNSAQAVAYLEQAVKINPQNLPATYQLALEIERQGDQGSEARFEQLMKDILASRPGNLAALLELSRISAKRGDAATLRSTVPQIAGQSAAWPPEVQQQLQALQSAAAGPDPHAAATRTVFLRNVLMRVPAFRQSLAAIKAQPGEEARPFTHFVRLESPSATPSPADMAMTYTLEPLPDADGARWNWIGAISLTGEGAPVIAEADGHQVRLSTGAVLPFPGGSLAVPPSPEGVLSVDFNYDFKTDLVLAGAGGVRFFRQDSPATFSDVTASTKLPVSVLNGSYTGAWAIDIEADGDMDIVLGSKSGVPTVLRNNGDGTFLAEHPFGGFSGLSQFVWADLNGDGNPDVALIDNSGGLHVFFNERSGNFRERPLASGFSNIRAVAAADVNSDGVLDLVVATGDGRIVRLSDAEDSGWASSEIARLPDARSVLDGEVRLHIADLDNNGAVDIVLAHIGAASGAQVWLGDDKGGFAYLGASATGARIFDLADVDGNGRLALLALSADGKPIRVDGHGAKSYSWQVLRPRARQATGDQRINSFGIGGEIEIRSGLLVQKQPITGPLVHFGLGDHAGADVARIIWPNGSVRAEFALHADQQVLTEQRLKGSCPFLFAFNGKQMAFVKDSVPWGSAIGLRINSLGSADIQSTEEWYKISRDELVPHDGYYDLRITGELWETYYYDYLSLMAVDHPRGTEVFTDERFVVPAAKLAVTAVETPHPIEHAVDDLGNDVTSTLRSLDGVYLDTFGRGQYQGVTRDHYVEIDLGKDAPAGGPLWLIARGWLHPSDSSINVALSQGHLPHPKPLSLEVPDGRGGWVVARSNLGFPAGRKKICLFDLTNVFLPGTPRRLRLRTNLEVYWDQIQWARGLPDATLKITRLAPYAADLHYRGYSLITQANASSPEIPDYNRSAGTAQRWHDLSGYYTRYGDVRELLAAVDDRYVIMNAGDEMSLRFRELPAPHAGWVRDFVIDGDGWIKDGDYNSSYSQTILPLPHHSRKRYDTPPGKLEGEWVYKRHSQDWETYQTRYVTPEVFEGALRQGADR